MLNKDFSRFGGGGDTFLTPVGLVLIVLLCGLILVLPRKYRMIPLLIGSILIPISQQLVVGGLHFMIFRVLIVLTAIRTCVEVSRGLRFRLTSLDLILIAWATSALITFTLLWGTLDALTNRLGLMYDSFGAYFVLRLLCRDEEDIRRTIKVIAIICLIIGSAMVKEKVGSTNPFSILGGASSVSEEEGRVRSAGPFAHPIIAGTVGAALVPLFMGLWWQGKSKLVALAGIIGSTAMVITAGSSTGLSAYAAGTAALFMWSVRNYMRVFRWGVLVILCLLHVSMKAPVWALIAHVDLTGGSSSYHRYELINQAILHFNEWWLVGEKTTYQWGFNLWDTANTYVETAVTGGLLTLILFIALISVAFKRLGISRKVATTPASARLMWILGAALFGNAVGFIGITFYDQSAVMWYTLLAMIGSATELARTAVVDESSPELADTNDNVHELPYQDQAAIY
jgi:hypothetical protein